MRALHTALERQQLLITNPKHYKKNQRGINAKVVSDTVKAKRTGLTDGAMNGNVESTATQGGPAAANAMRLVV